MDRISINEPSRCVRVWEGGVNAKQVYFSAKKYGSMQAAIDAAIDYEKQLPTEKRKGKKKHRFSPNSNNTSGAVGVSISRRKGQEMGYVASWTNSDGKKKSRHFSFVSYGQSAFREAKRWRDMMTAADKNSSTFE